MTAIGIVLYVTDAAVNKSNGGFSAVLRVSRRKYLCLAANDIKKPKREIVLLLNITNCDNIYKLFCGLRL